MIPTFNTGWLETETITPHTKVKAMRHEQRPKRVQRRHLRGQREICVEDAGREDFSEEIYNLGFRERV